MNDNQIKQITDAIYICKDEILAKLEDIRCGIIDVENELIEEEYTTRFVDLPIKSDQIRKE